MSQAPNPYEAPLTQSTGIPYFGEETPGQGVWTNGTEVILAIGAPLPHRCIKSNAPAETWLVRNLSWYPPWIFIFLFIGGPLIFVLVAILLSHKATIQIGLTREWAARRRSRMLVAWIGGLLGLLIMFSPAFLYELVDMQEFGGPVILVGGILLVGFVIYGNFAARMVYATRVSKQFARIRGVCPDYLAMLPPWPGYE